MINDKDEQIFYAGVQCVVLKNDSVLMGQRIQTSEEGTWALPGGHIKFAESPIDAGKRELYEEVSLEGLVATLRPSFVTYSTFVPYVHFPVVFEEVRGKAHVRPNEKFGELRYFPLNRLPSPLFLPAKMTIEGLLHEKESEYLDSTFSVRFFRLDLLSIKTTENRNRGYIIAFFRSDTESTVSLSWGRRGTSRWKHREESYKSAYSTIKRVEEVVKTRVKHNYLLAGAIGDLRIDWLSELFPTDAEIKVQAGLLTRRLASDKNFRLAYLRDQNLQSDLFGKL